MGLISKKLLVFLVIILSLCGFVGATDYYVKNGGDNGLDGQSDGNAWATIAKVNSEMGNFVGGDTISFNRGDTFTDAKLVITCDGAGTHIVFGAYGTGAKPIIDGSVNLLDGGILINDAGDGHITVQDIDITGLTHGNHTGIAVVWQHDNIIIQRCTVSNVGNNGIFVRHTDTFLIKDCVVNPSVGNSGIVVYGSQANAATNGTIDGCVTHGAATNDGVTFHNDGSGGGLYDVGANHTIKNCISYDNAENGFDITSGSNITLQDFETYGNDAGAILWGDVDGVIQRGKIHDEDDEGIIVGYVPSSLVIKNIIIWNTARYPIMLQGSTASSGVYIYHCSVSFSISGDAHFYVNDSYTDVRVKNTVFTSQTNGNPSTYVYYVGSATPANTSSAWDYNVYWNPDNDDTDIFRVGASYYNLADWQTTHSMDLNSPGWDNPDFVNPVSDWHIASGSPCQDAGTNLGVTDDYAGDTRPINTDYDIGAYEIQATPVAGWLTGWSYRKKITVDNTNIDGDLTSFPLYVYFSDADIDDETQATGNDIRFTQSDGSTLLTYKRRYYAEAAGSATGHFLVATSLLAASATEIYLYYGNAGAADGSGDPWDANFALVWPLNESSGSAVDETGNGNTGTYNGNLPDQQAGKFYMAQDFDGAGDYVSSSYQATQAGNFTVSLWFNTTNTDVTRYMVSQRAGVGHLAYHKNDDSIIGNIKDDDADSVNITAGSPAAGAWHLMTWFHDNDNNKWTGRIDAGAKVEGDASLITAITEDDTFEVGRWDVNTNYLGRIQEVRVSDKVREDAWTKFYFNNINEGDNELSWGAEEQQQSETQNTTFHSMNFSAMILILPFGMEIWIIWRK